MSRHLTGGTESRLPPGDRSVARVELLTMAALAVSTAVAATAVSIGIARADVLGSVANGGNTPLFVMLCVLLAASIALAPRMKRKPQRH